MLAALSALSGISCCDLLTQLALRGLLPTQVRIVDHWRLCATGKGLAGGVSELACLDHPRLVNSAYFSPQTGSKLMSTCIDNRIRVWDYLHSIDKPCDREIVHSHDFNRYLTPFRAEWDPKDPHERLLVVGR